MILPAQEIRARGIFTPFHERTSAFGLTFGLSAAGYDVRVAEDHFLMPGGFALASTVEHFAIPADLVAIVHDKSTWARRGLAVQNTVAEPGWRGHLTLELSNHGQEALQLSAGMPIAQIILHRLSAPTDQPYTGKYQDQEAGPQAARLEAATDAPPVAPQSGNRFPSPEDRAGIARMERDVRQDRMGQWVPACFGANAMHPRERAERVLEEALELAQCEYVSMDRVALMAQAVYAKPPGTPGQEVGGVSTCLLAYCESRGISADTAERLELERITALPPEHFRARHKAKFESGLAIRLQADGDAA